MSTATPGSVRTAAHRVDRLTVAVGVTYDEFRTRYEAAVPPLDAARLDALQSAGADWEEILRAAADNAPHHFILYWRFDAEPLMRLARDRWRCTQYLMGNHTIAQRMYRHNPAIMLYAPLRTAIFEDAAGTTWFEVDQPSTHFSSFATDEITAVGIELDHLLAELLDTLGVPVPEALALSRATPPASGR